LRFTDNPVICLAGKTGAGKSVVARYLALFYGFEWVRTRNIIHQLLLEDLARPSEGRLFERSVDPSRITEQDLRDFGAILLDRYHQAPIRERLTATVQSIDGPVVVDSIRDADDVTWCDLAPKPVLTWFVDCSDTLIRSRTAKKTKLGEPRIKSGSPVDRTAPIMRGAADQIIPNFGTLEDLRWQVDDKLFESMSIVQSLET
jgi:dephospho-CoA kinase